MQCINSILIQLDVIVVFQVESSRNVYLFLYSLYSILQEVIMNDILGSPLFNNSRVLFQYAPFSDKNVSPFSQHLARCIFVPSLFYVISLQPNVPFLHECFSSLMLPMLSCYDVPPPMTLWSKGQLSCRAFRISNGSKA